MARFYEQKIVTDGIIINRFFSHSSKEGRNIAAERRAGVPCATYHRLFNEEEFEDMKVGAMKHFGGQTVITRIA